MAEDATYRPMSLGEMVVNATTLNAPRIEPRTFSERVAERLNGPFYDQLHMDRYKEKVQVALGVGTVGLLSAAAGVAHYHGLFDYLLR